MKREPVLTVIANKLPTEILTSGMHAVSIQNWSELINQDDIWIMSRIYAESNESYKQLIPYIVIKYDGKFLCCNRGSKGTEGRLSGLTFFGLGGHINVGDIIFDQESSTIAVDQTIENATNREIYEEVKLSDFYSKSILGIINDYTLPVNRVHLGLVELWEPNSLDGLDLEKIIKFEGFYTKEELASKGDKLESWSRLVLEYL